MKDTADWLALTVFLVQNHLDNFLLQISFCQYYSCTLDNDLKFIFYSWLRAEYKSQLQMEQQPT